MVKLDRKIRLDLPGRGRDATGGPLAGAPLETRWVYAGMNDTAARAQLLSGREDTAAATTFTIRWQSIDNRWQVTYGDQVYRVTGTLERGRRQYIDLLCEAVK